MPSLRDVARELNVSVSLVSKVLNDRLGTTGVRPGLTEQIRETARKMGYRKNFSAISLLARRQNALAVFVHSHGAQGSGLVEKMLDGISQATATRSQRISLEFFLDAGEFRAKRQNLHSGQIDGLIVSGVGHPELLDDFLEIQETEVPIITVYNHPIHRKIPNIGIPHAALSEAATTHLVERGCRKIAHFAVNEERAAGHRRALRKAGLPFRKDLLIELEAPEGFRAPGGRAAASELLKRNVPFDGISAQSDTQAATALHELIRRGIRIPQDVKIIGIDNAPFDDLCYVPLSSVSQRFVERGRLAVEIMNRILDGEKPGSINLAPTIHPRASTKV